MRTFQITKVEERKDAAIKLEDAEKTNPFRDLVYVGRSSTGQFDTIPVPEVDFPFFFEADRMANCLRTSLVKEIIEQTENRIVFKTMNSIYKIEVVDNA